MTVDAEAVLQNFETLAAHEIELPDTVYELLFGAHPELLELFTARNSAASRQMVRETLMYAVDHLHGADWVVDNMESLRTKHVAYEVTDEMYAWYTEAMLAAMSKVSGDAWTPTLEADWREVLQYLVDLMTGDLPPGGDAEPSDLAAEKA
jgi:nitric oxide dioxygenase